MGRVSLNEPVMLFNSLVVNWERQMIGLINEAVDQQHGNQSYQEMRESTQRIQV